MTHGEEVVWRQPFGTHERLSPPSGHFVFNHRTQAGGHPERIVQVTDEAMRVFGLFPGRLVLLREITSASLCSALKTSRRPSLCKAVCLDDRLVLVLKVDKIGTIVALFGIFSDSCQIVFDAPPDEAVLDVFLCEHDLFMLCSGKLIVRHSNGRLCSAELPEGVQPVKLSCLQLDDGSSVAAVYGRTGKWAIFSAHPDSIELVGVYGNEADHEASVNFLTISSSSSPPSSSPSSSTSSIDLFVGVGGSVYIQRMACDTYHPLEAREMLRSPHQCIGIGVFAGGAKTDTIPTVTAVKAPGAIQFHIVVLRMSPGDGLVCEDLGVDEFRVEDSFAAADWVFNESTLEAYCLSSHANIYSFSGLTLRNSWTCAAFNRLSATFDFSRWFNLLGPFPFAGKSAPPLDSVATRLLNYPPGSWSELRSVVDSVLQNPSQSDALSQIYYILLDCDPRSATAFAWEYGLSAEECREVKTIKGLVKADQHHGHGSVVEMIKQAGISSALKMVSVDDKVVEDLIDVVLRDSSIDKAFLDFPFDADALERVLSTLKAKGSERAADLTVLLLFYHSRYSEILEFAQSHAVTNKTKPIIDNLSIMLTGSVQTFKRPPRMPIRLDHEKAPDKQRQSSPKKTPVKLQSPRRQSHRRHFTPVPLVPSPNSAAGQHQDHSKDGARQQRLARQPSIVNLATPRHHPSITPSRLGRSEVSDMSSSTDSKEGVMESSPRREASSPSRKTPSKRTTPTKSTPSSTPIRHSPRLAEKQQHRAELVVDLSSSPYSPPPYITAEPTPSSTKQQEEGRKKKKEKKRRAIKEEPPSTVTMRSKPKTPSGTRHSPRSTKKRRQ